LSQGTHEPWRPIGTLPDMARAIDDHVAQLEEQHAALQAARAQPFVVDDATVANVVRVHVEVLEDAALFEEQLARWRPVADSAQDAELNRLQEQMIRYRGICERILAMASELRRATVEAVLRNPGAALDQALASSRPLHGPGAPFQLPDGVSSRREALDELSVRYHFTHRVLGRLGSLTCRPRADGRTDFVTEVLNVPGESRERRRERVELFLPTAFELSQRVAHEAARPRH